MISSSGFPASKGWWLVAAALRILSSYLVLRNKYVVFQNRSDRCLDIFRICFHDHGVKRRCFALAAASNMAPSLCLYRHPLCFAPRFSRARNICRTPRQLLDLTRRPSKKRRPTQHSGPCIRSAKLSLLSLWSGMCGRGSEPARMGSVLTA